MKIVQISPIFSATISPDTQIGTNFGIAHKTLSRLGFPRIPIAASKQSLIQRYSVSNIADFPCGIEEVWWYRAGTGREKTEKKRVADGLLIGLIGQISSPGFRFSWPIFGTFLRFDLRSGAGT